jgi:hypothetical protein
MNRLRFFRPCRDLVRFVIENPALKRWAIFRRGCVKKTVRVEYLV